MTISQDAGVRMASLPKIKLKMQSFSQATFAKVMSEGAEFAEVAIKE